MSNAELIAEIRARADAVTEGPWAAARAFGGRVYLLANSGTADEIRLASIFENSDAKFIAHAREDIPNLLAALERAEAEVVRLNWVIGAVQSLVAPIVADGKGKIGTHYENCYETHAGCLAVYVVGIVEEGAK